VSDKLTVVLPTINEAGNVGPLIASLRETLGEVIAEVLVIDGDSTDSTREEAASQGARVLVDKAGYAAALVLGFKQANTPWVMVLDADGSHRADDALKLWQVREGADVVVGSRMVQGGGSDSGAFRRLLSRTLAWLFAAFARLPARDISSGFRLYRRELVVDTPATARFFEVQPTLLAHAVSRGAKVKEVGIHYHQRGAGQSKNRVFRYGMAFLRALWRLRS
jgi:dolichol-phosphate mannosyltransferase